MTPNLTRDQRKRNQCRAFSLNCLWKHTHVEEVWYLSHKKCIVAVGLDVNSAATVSQFQSIWQEQHWAVFTSVLLSRASSHPCSYLSSSSHKSGSSLAQWHRSLHPDCHMEVKLISLQHSSTAWAFLLTSITQVVPRLEWEQVGEHMLGAQPGTVTELYGFIIQTHKLSPSRAPFQLPVFIIVQQDLNSKSLKG